jgi:integrase
VFLYPSAIAALRDWERVRDEAFPEPRSGAFLVNARGRPLAGSTVQHQFAALARAAGIQAPPGRRPPRLHGMWH